MVMPASHSPDDRTLKEIQNWLQTASDFPAKYGRIYERARREPLRWLPALVHHSVHDKSAAGKIAVRILAGIVHETRDIDILLLVLDLLPRRSSVLAEVSVEAAQKMLECFPLGQRSKGSEAAMLWNNLSERWHDADQPQKALDCAQQAVAIGDTLPPEDIRMRVITRLTLAKCLALVGQTKSAVAAASAAFSLACALDDAGRTADPALKAQSAVIFANRLAEIGNLKEAADMADMAARLIRELPESSESPYNLALAEHSLANQLTRQGLHESSLPHAEHAEQVFRILSSENPEEYVEYATAAAATYSHNLTHVGQLQRAYDLSFGNVERMREYAKRQPTRYGFEFTAHLMSLSDCASELGRYQEALLFGKEAVDHARQLGRLARRRDWYLEGQANVNLFSLYYRLRKFAEAAKSIRAAERAFKNLKGTHPDAGMERIRALRGLGEVERMLARDGHSKRALRAAGQALELLKEQRFVVNDAWLMLEAHCRTTYAACLNEGGNMEESFSQEWASLRLRKRLFKRSPLIYQADLANSLSQLARRFLKTGNPEKAQPLAEQAVSHYEQALDRLPERSIPLMADALWTLGEIHLERRQVPQGMAILVRGIRLLRPYYEKNADLWVADLLPLCARYVELCGNTNVDFEKALVEDVIVHAKRINAGA